MQDNMKKSELVNIIKEELQSLSPNIKGLMNESVLKYRQTMFPYEWDKFANKFIKANKGYKVVTKDDPKLGEMKMLVKGKDVIARFVVEDLKIYHNIKEFIKYLR